MHRSSQARGCGCGFDAWPRGSAFTCGSGADQRIPRDIDQLLLDPQGLPGRPWYKNLIDAPGTLTGYGAKTLPGVREAIEQRRWDDARAYVVRTAAVIENYANRLDEVTAMARSAP